MADEVQIKFGADIGGAISALNTLKQAVSGAAEPVARLKNAFVDAGAAVQSSGAAALAVRADMQRMVAERAISLRQALGFDIEYAGRRSDQERLHFDRVLASDAATLAEKSESYGALVELSGRYEAQLAQDQRRLAEAARREADRLAQPYRQAFDEIGAGWRSAVIGLVEGTLSFRTAALGIAQSVERGFPAWPRQRCPAPQWGRCRRCSGWPAPLPARASATSSAMPSAGGYRAPRRSSAGPPPGWRTLPYLPPIPRRSAR